MPMVPISWLADHVEVPEGMDAKGLAAALVKVGLEEETIHPAKVIGPLVVGKILSRVEETASNGKIINYCRVDVGEYNDAPGSGKEPSELASRGIICGAHNFDVGDLVVVSLPGAVLPGDFTIAARKTYGHISDGMICSARELGLGTDHDGIIVLPEMFPDRDIPTPGSDLIAFLGLGEEILEINVTPDRGYCFSMRGVAREFSHSTGTTFTDPGVEGALVASVPQANESGFPVEVKDSAPIKGRVGADRFVTRIVRGVDPNAATPQWMVERLESAGMRSVSLPVDVTNYVMLDLGQPMHAYDVDALAAPIVVRRAKAGEKLTTLDEVERELDPEDLLITDSPEGKGSRIIGLAGVMGGFYSEVEESTRDILLEAAHFDAVSIARTARRHRIPSEASKRFERGTDPLLPAIGAQRAVDLLVEYGGGVADPAVFDFNEVPDPTVILFHYEQARRLTGVDYPKERVEELLGAIGCTVREQEDGSYEVVPPSWRPDLVGPAHLVEEIARLDGYDSIPALLPTAPSGRGLTPSHRARREASAALAGAGLVEVLTYPFVSDSFDRQGFTPSDPRRHALVVRNPLAEDAPFLRTSILDTLLDAAGRNIARGAERVAIFESGRVARPAGTVPTGLLSADERPSDEELAALKAGTPSQPQHVGIVLSGRASGWAIGEAERSFAWSDALEIVRALASVLGVSVEVTRAWNMEAAPVKGAPMPQAARDPQDVAPWHPGRVARIFVRRGREFCDIALAGELHPRVCAAFGLPARTAAAEIDLDALIASMPIDPIRVAPVSTFPVAKEDIALVVPASIPVSRVEQVVRQGAGPLAEEIRLFDVYEGENLGSGVRSLAFALKLRAPDRTLTAKEAAKVRHDIVKKAEKVLGATLRS